MVTVCCLDPHWCLIYNLLLLPQLLLSWSLITEQEWWSSSFRGERKVKALITGSFVNLLILVSRALRVVLSLICLQGDLAHIGYITLWPSDTGYVVDIHIHTLSHGKGKGIHTVNKKGDGHFRFVTGCRSLMPHVLLP